MPRFVIECPWCCEPIVRTGQPAYCDVCRHRADVSRARCDCPRCSTLPERERQFLARVMGPAEHQEPTR